MDDKLHQLIQKIKQFNSDRDWDQYHNAKDLVIALMSEVGELAECYRWLNEDEMNDLHADASQKEKIAEEIADIFTYLVTLSYKADIDLVEAVEKKLEKNKLKYPIDKIKGKHTNPIKGYKG